MHLSSISLSLVALAFTCPAGGQIQTPAEVLALPRWSGEKNAAESVPPHYVFRDANGQMVVSYPYPDKPGRRVTYRFWLPNRVDPQITASVGNHEETGRSIFTYTYTLRNGETAVAAILQWSVVGPPNQKLTVSHPSWKAYNAQSPVARQALLPHAPMGAFLVWSAVNVPKLSAGTELGKFTIRSSFLPGLTTAYASGEGVLEEPEGEFPEAVIQELIPLQRPHVWQRPIVTIGPRFAPGTPLPEILGDFRNGLSVLVKHELLDSNSTYVQELQAVLGNSESTAARVLNRIVPPQSAIEKELDSAIRTSVFAIR